MSDGGTCGRAPEVEGWTLRAPNAVPVYADLIQRPMLIGSSPRIRNSTDCSAIGAVMVAPSIEENQRFGAR